MKVGLVLEGGALRTIFSTGVFDALLEKNVMADYVVGVSAGIAYGVSYVSKQPRRNLEILTRFVNDRRYMGLNNLVDRHNRSYFGLEFSYCTIPNELVPFDYQTFEAFPGHVEAGVTNLETGQAEYKEVTTEDKHFRLLQAPAPCPSCFRYSIWTASPIWTEVRPTRCPTAGPLSRGATGWWSFSPSPGALSESRKGSFP